MDLQNLATVIAPNILYPRGRDLAREESFTAIRVMTRLLEDQDQYFIVPSEMLPMLHDQDYFASCLDMPSKEALKKCDTYMRVKQGRGGPSMPQTPLPSNGNSNGSPANGSERPIHSQRSDPMMRGRPNPPFASEDNAGGSGKRSPRSQSRGPASYPALPPSSHGHSSAHGHAASPPPIQDNNVYWAPGSPSGSSSLHQNLAASYNPTGRPSAGPNQSNSTRPPGFPSNPNGDPSQWTWEPPQPSRSRPNSPYGTRPSYDHSKPPQREQ